MWGPSATSPSQRLWGIVLQLPIVAINMGRCDHQIPFWCMEYPTQACGLPPSRNVLLRGIQYSFPCFPPACKGCWKRNVSCLERNSIAFFSFALTMSLVGWELPCTKGNGVGLIPKRENKSQQLFTWKANSFRCSTGGSVAADQSHCMLLGERSQQLLQAGKEAKEKLSFLIKLEQN